MALIAYAMLLLPLLAPAQLERFEVGWFDMKSNAVDRNSCCGILQRVNKWDDKNFCYEWVIEFETNFSDVEQMKRNPEAVTKDLEQALDRPGDKSKDRIKDAISEGVKDCDKGDAKIPQSEQIVTDIQFMQANAVQFERHLMHTNFAKEARAFELVLGNALATFEPLRQTLQRFVLAFVTEMEAVSPDIPVNEYAKVFDGPCFAGFTTDFANGTSLTDLKKWIRNANSRELITKFYNWIGDFYSDKPWQQTEEKNLCELHETSHRMLDPMGVFPRYRMPLTSIGLGWLDLQQASAECRYKVQWPWGETLKKYNASLLFPREETLDPPLSHDEEAKLASCPDVAPRGRVRWIAGKFGYLMKPDSSLLWFMSQIVGLNLASGVSGSTYVIMSTAETLNFQMEDLALLRLALMGWMMPFQDHSMIEVMMGAHRSFPGRSFPKWTSGMTVPTINDWREVHRHLLPDDFNHDGVTLKGLNDHISAYIGNFNAKHGTEVSWPGQVSQVKWWEHAVFDYVNDELVSEKTKSSPYSALNKCAPSADPIADSRRPTIFT